MNDNIENKVVLITGGSTGIGAEVARLLASRGAKVAIAARRKDKLDEVVAAIEAAGGTAKAYSLDVTDKKQVEAVVAAAVADFGKLDVSINNAGLMPIRPMSEVNTDEWDAMIDVNLKGMLTASPPCCRASSRSRAATSSTSARWSASRATPVNRCTRPRRRACSG